MNHLQADVVVIGAGTAGIRAFREAERCGVRVLFVERGPLGTTCARVGCMPSKLLIQAADIAHTVRCSSRFGIHASLERVDGREVLRRVRALRNDFVRSVLETIAGIRPDLRLAGSALFEAPGVVRVGATQVRTKAVVIATGSSPLVPQVFHDLDPSVVLTTDSFFEIEHLPRSIAVIGAGYVGLEMAQALHRLGVKTTVFEMKETLSLMRDARTRQLAERIFGEELDLWLGAEIRRARPRNGGVEIEWTSRRGERSERRFDRILCATGRKPNIDDLEISRALLRLDDSGMPEVDDRSMRCAPLEPSDAGFRVYMAGDVVGTRPVLHEAADEGRIAGLNAASRDGDRSYLRNTPLTIVFTDPQLATVGGGPSDPDVIAARSSYESQGRARVMGKNYGEACLYASQSDARLVGADLVMPGAEHIAHLITTWIQSRLTVEDVLDLPIYHPVLEEGLRGALKRLGASLGLTRMPDEGGLDCGPGT